MSPVARRTAWLVAYGVAMGFLEAAVVVYLRELYYPRGFAFPVTLLPDRIALVEIAREAATIVMLLAVAVLTERRPAGRFFAFAFLFGVWDLTYYAVLWLVLGWPSSLLTWDLLFLIPVPWLSPVLHPVTVSSLFVAGWIAHATLDARGSALAPTRREWLASAVGALLLVVAFCWRWRDVVDGRLPGAFPDLLFWPALALAAAPLVRAWRRGLQGVEQQLDL